MENSNIKIYHNPRCRKSREGLQLLENSNQSFEIIKYLDNPLTSDELTSIINLLNIQPIDLVRKNEAIWKEKFKGKSLSNDAIIKAMVDYPKLIERPIVTKGNKAVVGRPPELIKTLL